MKTIVGGWTNAANGALQLQLDNYAFIGGSYKNAPKTYKVTLGPEGEIPVFRIWGNDEIRPEGTQYRVTIFDFSDFVLFGPQSYALCGDSPIDMTTLISFCGQPSVGGGPGLGFSTFPIQLDNMFGQPGDGQAVCLYTSFSQQVFPPNFINPTSYGTCGVNPQSTATYRIFVTHPGGVNVPMGTIQIAPSGLFTFSTPGFALNPGDRLVITAPSPADWLLSDVALSIVGTRLT
jgi:hypothetical protein